MMSDGIQETSGPHVNTIDLVLFVTSLSLQETESLQIENACVGVLGWTSFAA